MAKKKITYVGIYDCVENRAEQRHFSPATETKMRYVASALANLGYEVDIASYSGTKANRSFPAKKIELQPGVVLNLFHTIGGHGFWRKKLNKLVMKSSLIWHLLCLPRKATVIVYHVPRFAKMVMLLKWLKSFRLILEVEEIYADLSGKEKTRKREWKLFAKADGYIFPTNLLDEVINTEKKPSVIIHGTYQVREALGTRESFFQRYHWNPQKCHVVYAGNLALLKGASVAAKTALFLPENYHVHILGVGTQSDVQQMKELVASIARQAKSTISYDGMLLGDDYIEFLQNCEIGISPQSPDARFNGTSFPSKILSYMANGLRVVSIRIPAIEQSAVGKYLSFFDEQTPEQVARTIMQVKLDDGFDGRSIITKLARKCEQELDALLTTA